MNILATGILAKRGSRHGQSNRFPKTQVDERKLVFPFAHGQTTQHIGSALSTRASVLCDRGIDFVSNLVVPFLIFAKIEQDPRGIDSGVDETGEQGSHDELCRCCECLFIGIFMISGLCFISGACVSPFETFKSCEVRIETGVTYSRNDDFVITRIHHRLHRIVLCTPRFPSLLHDFGKDQVQSRTSPHLAQPARQGHPGKHDLEGRAVVHGREDFESLVQERGAVCDVIGAQSAKRQLVDQPVQRVEGVERRAGVHLLIARHAVVDQSGQVGFEAVFVGEAFEETDEMRADCALAMI